MLTNLPGSGEEIYAVVQQGMHWWPQGQILIDPQEMKWTASVTLGEEGEFVVHLIKASILGRNLIRFYYKVGGMDRPCESDAQFVRRRSPGLSQH